MEDNLEGRVCKNGYASWKGIVVEVEGEMPMDWEFNGDPPHFYVGNNGLLLSVRNIKGDRSVEVGIDLRDLLETFMLVYNREDDIHELITAAESFELLAFCCRQAAKGIKEEMAFLNAQKLSRGNEP